MVVGLLKVDREIKEDISISDETFTTNGDTKVSFHNNSS